MHNSGNTFSFDPVGLNVRRPRKSGRAPVSLRKILRVVIVLAASTLCWAAIGWFTFQIYRLAAH
jgi:hypothetical protein